MGADAAVGNTKIWCLWDMGTTCRFFATSENFKRKIPGRIIGVSKDIMGKSLKNAN